MHTQQFQKGMLVRRDNMYNLELSSTSFCEEKKREEGGEQKLIDRISAMRSVKWFQKVGQTFAASW